MIVIFDANNDNLVLETFDNRGASLNGLLESRLEFVKSQAVGTSSDIQTGFSLLRLAIGSKFETGMLGKSKSKREQLLQEMKQRNKSELNRVIAKEKLQNPRIVCVCPDSGYLLCNDNQWRKNGQFGHKSYDVKFYSYAKAAHNAMENNPSPNNKSETISNLVYLYFGESINDALRR